MAALGLVAAGGLVTGTALTAAAAPATTADQAASIALARVSGATTDNIYVVKDYDDGRYTWEGEIILNNVEYDFEIGSNGTIRDWEVERYAGLADRSGLITKAQATQAVLNRVPGATSANLRIYLERDDGRYEFDGELIKGGVLYDFEINATTGNFQQWQVRQSATSGSSQPAPAPVTTPSVNPTVPDPAPVTTSPVTTPSANNPIPGFDISFLIQLLQQLINLLLSMAV
jgi:uncharacterized membrane protein YkoI